LLDRGAAVDAREPEYQQTALMLAVRENHPDAVQLLIERGADVNAQTRIGPTPKFVPPCKSTGCGSEGVGINRGGLPDRGRRNAALGGMTPLLYAARDGRLEEARLLVAGGADIELAEANDMRPLLMALLNDQVEVARLLLEHRADPNADDFWGRSPLFAAVDYRNLDMNNRDEDTPTTNYVDRAPLLAMMALLIEHGANVNAQTRELPPSRRWLYSLGDVSWVDFTGQTPFLRAALAGDVPAMRLLLEHGADPNLPTQAGTTPLMAAAGVNWVVAQTYTVSKEALLEALDLCFEHGADVNAANSMGLTALLGAANRGSNEIIAKLAARGADLYDRAAQ
jgi:ankyrin repeat protein